MSAIVRRAAGVLCVYYTMMSLSPSYQKVLRVRGLIAGAALLAVAVAIEALILRETSLPTGILLIAALLVAAVLALVIPPRRYGAWSYDESEDELHVAHGIWLRSLTVMPYGRVQHIDVAQGPLERRYGVGTLILHAAGTHSSAVTLPGLDMPEAERMRDAIRGKIRQDMV